MTPDTKISADGINFRLPTAREVFKDEQEIQNKLLKSIADTRDALADMIEESGHEPFNFGLDCACSDINGITDFIQLIKENFKLVKREI